MLTLKELQQELKISKITIYRYVKSGKLTAYRVGGKFLFKREDIEKFLSTMKTIDK